MLAWFSRKGVVDSLCYRVQSGQSPSVQFTFCSWPFLIDTLHASLSASHTNTRKREDTPDGVRGGGRKIASFFDNNNGKQDVVGVWQGWWQGGGGEGGGVKIASFFNNNNGKQEGVVVGGEGGYGRWGGGEMGRGGGSGDSVNSIYPKSA